MITENNQGRRKKKEESGSLRKAILKKVSLGRKE